MPKVVIKTAEGKNQEVDFEVSVYRAAADNYMSVPQYLQLQYPTNVAQDGTAFEQIMAQTGLFLHRDPSAGIRPPRLAQVFDGSAVINAGVIVRDANPASRIVFPAVILEAIETALRDDKSSYVSMFEQMVAIDDSIQGPRYEYPVINYGDEVNSPTNMRSRGIGQNMLPPAMISITVSDVSRAIPTFSLGLEISNEAAAASSLDLVALALARQAELERAARVEEYIQAFHSGDADHGQSALSATNVSSLDAASTGGALTHLGWMKYLARNFLKRRIDWVMCDMATAVKIETRTGKPTVETDNPTSPRIDALPTIANPLWQPVRIFILQDGVIDTGHILGLDSRYAIRRVRNVQADYQAVEEFVLKKSRAMRFDFGEVAYRLYDEAWDLLNLA